MIAARPELATRAVWDAEGLAVGMSNEITEDEHLTFPGWLRYQRIDPATLTQEELTRLQRIFEELGKRSKPVGLIKLKRVPGEQKYAVAIQDGSDLWLTLWIRCSQKGEIFIMQPRGDSKWDPHASYHVDGTLHRKSYGRGILPQKCQPLTQSFRGHEHLGTFGGHGKRIGAIFDPGAFDGVVAVAAGALGPTHGSVAVDLVQPGYGPRHDPRVFQREIFFREDRPSVMITIWCDNSNIGFPAWPDDFVPLT